MTPSLSKALRTGKLEQFISEQEEIVPPVDRREFEAALGCAIKPLQPEDRISRSASRDGSRGK